MFSKTKLPNYTAPIYPFLAMVLALNWDVIFQSKKHNVLLIISAIVPIALVTVLKYLGSELPELASYPDVWKVVLPSAIIGAVAILFLIFSKTAPGFTLVCFSYVALSLGLLGFGFPQVDSHNPVKSALKDLPAGAEIYYWEDFNPAFPFNIHQVIPPWKEGKSVGKIFILTTSRALEKHPFPQAFEEIFRAKDLFEKTETIIIRPLSSE